MSNWTLLTDVAFATLRSTRQNARIVGRTGEMRYGKYLRTDRRLGAGGNGEVWLCTRNGRKVAVKVLARLGAKRYARFRSEISVLLSLGDFEGIVPLIDHELPARPTKSAPAWYAMPIAASSSALSTAPFRKRIEAFAYLASGLTELHARGVFHRDIKLANILDLEGRWCLSDFGLAEWSGSEDLTSLGEAVGPKWTQAPEMRRTARAASGAPADVYSFAKTLWIALTGQDKGFDGRFDYAIAEQDLRTYHVRQTRLHSLHALLRDCTEYDPTSRPSMREVHTRLAEWVANEFHVTASLEWKHMQSLILTKHIPSRATWYDAERIAAVLNEAVTVNMNHCFYSRGGGMDFEACRVGAASDLLECLFGRKYVVRPGYLELVSFAAAPHWSYFWLQLDELEQTGTYEDLPDDTEFEEVTELPDGSFLALSCWDNDEYLCDGDYVPLPKGARPIVRCLRGAWAIFGKASPYNHDPRTYDARHAKMGSHDFFQYILAHVEWETNGSVGVPRVEGLPVGFERNAASRRGRPTPVCSRRRPRYRSAGAAETCCVRRAPVSR